MWIAFIISIISMLLSLTIFISMSINLIKMFKGNKTFHDMFTHHLWSMIMFSITSVSTVCSLLIGIILLVLKLNE